MGTTTRATNKTRPAKKAAAQKPETGSGLPDDVDTVVRALIAGKLDEHLDLITDAAAHRILEKNGSMNWRIECDDFTIDTDGATLAEYDRIVELAGSGTWLTVTPVRTPSAFLRAFYESRCGMDAEKAAERAGEWTRADCEEAISEFLAVPGPFKGRPPSTS